MLVVAETVYLISAGTLTDPLWFDSRACLSLVVGLIAGALLMVRRRAAPHLAAPA